MANKINYYNLSIEEMEKIDKNQRPTLLLHACCAPCSSHTLRFLSDRFRVTILYFNSNIFPFKEYKKRRDEIELFVENFNRKENHDVSILFPKYDYEGYMEELRQYENVSEGGVRCQLCYKKRIVEVLHYGSLHNFDYATTTLTISRQKNSQIINEIAAEVAKEFPNIKYFYSDFKKQGGLEEVQQMKQEYGMYQQQYCGCEYSLRDAIKFRGAKIEE